MARKGKGGAILALGLGFGAALAAGAAFAGAKKVPMKKPSLEKLLELVDKYSAAFNVPKSLLIAILNIESNFTVEAENHTARAEQFGGAWGIGQILLTTGRDLVKRFPDTAKKYWAGWDGSGTGLKDPDINISMAAFLLGQSYKHYAGKIDGPWMLAGLAHHQGRGNVDKFLKAGNGKIDETKLPPFGKRYWQQLKEYQQHAADIV